jgi:hypothetical protein
LAAKSNSAILSFLIGKIKFCSSISSVTSPLN